MAKKKRLEFDAKQFLKMAKEKASAEDLMKTFGFKTTTQVKAAHYKALIEAGGVEPVVAGRGAGKTATVNKVKVGARGSVIIPKELIEDFGFSGETEFTVKKRGTGFITLKKVEPEE